MILTAASLIFGAAGLYLFFRVVRGYMRAARLPAVWALPDRLPLVSVVAAAKEGPDNLGEWLQHWTRQTYPKLEIVAVNDISNAAAGMRLGTLKAWTSRKPRHGPPLKAVHITQIPQGWLGKHYAMYQGCKQARGEFLLFADANVRLLPDAVRQAAAVALRDGADHVALLVQEAQPFSLAGFINYFLFGVRCAMPLWLAGRSFAGSLLGGNGIRVLHFIRREAYEAIGTHREIKMRTDGEVHLVVLTRKAGFRQRVILWQDGSEPQNEEKRRFFKTAASIAAFIRKIYKIYDRSGNDSR